MTPQELKNSILQLAIQGKLVPQRAEEGTAEELYNQIQAEKQKLIQAGKIKKEKNLPAITNDEKPFEIPDSWKWMRLGDVGSWASGSTPSRSNPEYYGGNIPWLKTGDLNDDYIIDTSEYITELALNKTSVRLNPIGSVLMAMYGATIGKIGILKIEATTNQACCACIPCNGIYNKYLFYFLLAYRKDFIKMGAGGAQPNISKEKIVTTVFPLPPLAEQKRIVAKIEKLLPYVERYEKAYNELQQLNKRFPVDLQKSVLQLAIQGKLVSQCPEEGNAEDLYNQIQAEKQNLIKAGKIKKEKPLPAITDDEKPFAIPDSWKWEKPFAIPDSWKWVRLNSLVIKDIRRGKSPKYVVKSDVVAFAQKCNTKLGYIDLSLAKFIDESVLSKYDEVEFLQNNDIIINSTGTGTLGRVGIFNSTDNPQNLIILPDSHVTTIRLTELVYCYYMFYCLKNFQSYFEKCGDGSTKQKELKPETIKNVFVPLPPLAEQKRIVAKLEEILPLCDKLK